MLAGPAQDLLREQGLVLGRLSLEWAQEMLQMLQGKVQSREKWLMVPVKLQMSRREYWW